MNICKNCGKETKENRIYCSFSCRNIFVNENLRNYQKNGEAIKKKFIDEYNLHPKKCKWCNKDISYIDRKKAHCSKECRKMSLIKWNKAQTGIKKNFSEEGLENIRQSAYKKHDRDVYDNSPNYCKLCGTSLPFEKKRYKFCDIDCKRTYDRKNLNDYQKYRKDSSFKFNLSDYPNEFDFTLITEYGWYNAKNHGDNLTGISRDHMISIKYGFKNNIDSKIISHPANCMLMKQNDNSMKYTNCSITLSGLIEKINIWDQKYKNNMFTPPR